MTTYNIETSNLIILFTNKDHENNDKITIDNEDITLLYLDPNVASKVIVGGKGDKKKRVNIYSIMDSDFTFDTSNQIIDNMAKSVVNIQDLKNKEEQFLDIKNNLINNIINVDISMTSGEFTYNDCSSIPVNFSMPLSKGNLLIKNITTDKNLDNLNILSNIESKEINDIYKSIKYNKVGIIPDVVKMYSFKKSKENSSKKSHPSNFVKIETTTPILALTTDNIAVNNSDMIGQLNFNESNYRVLFQFHNQVRDKSSSLINAELIKTKGVKYQYDLFNYWISLLIEMNIKLENNNNSIHNYSNRLVKIFNQNIAASIEAQELKSNFTINKSKNNFSKSSQDIKLLNNNDKNGIKVNLYSKNFFNMNYNQIKNIFTI